MTQQIILVGTAPNDGTGDPLRTSFQKANANFTELYGAATDGTVTSVNVSGGTTGLTAAGGPITGAGTITLGGVLNVANGGTGIGTALTEGSLVFAGAGGVLSQDNANLAWSDTFNTLAICSTPSVNNTVRIAGNLTGSVGANGVRVAPTVLSDVTTLAAGVSVALSTQAAAFTTTLVAFRADAGALGAGSTVLDNVGVKIEPLTIGNNIYGLQSAIAAGANRWNIYAAGTAQNAFAGNTRIGSTAAPTVALDVTGVIVSSGVMRPGVFTFATLPSGVASGPGCRAYITDCTTAVFNAAAAGGGAIGVPVFVDNAGAWKVG